MKLLHLADLHLGKRLNGFDLLEDQRHVLEQTVQLCDTHGVNTVVLAGDLYDSSVPTAAASELLSWFLTELAVRGIVVVAIAGNHDSARRLDYGSRLLARQGVHIAARFDGVPTRVMLHDRYGAVEFTLLPFVRTAAVQRALPEANITDYASAVTAVLDSVPVFSGRRVLVAHQLVTGSGQAPSPGGSETGLSGENADLTMDAALLEGYSYVALGHIHRPQRAGADTIRYAGSPLCYHLDECGAEKSAVLLNLGRRGVEDMQLLPLVPRRAMRHLTGPLEKLTAHPADTQDYIWATLTDETPLPDALALLRAVYPNTMKLEYACPPGRAVPDAVPLGKPLEELFGDFFAMQHGRGMTDAERRALLTLRHDRKEAE